MKTAFFCNCGKIVALASGGNSPCSNAARIWAERSANGWPCSSAADSAASAGHPVDGADRRKERDAKKNQDDGERYKGAARTAMEIAMKMSDDLMRDAGVSEIIELCLKANDIKTARILFRAIQSPSIRDSMLSDHPALRP